MKLTDDLPKWIKWPVRTVVYAVVLFVLFNVVVAVVQGRAASHALECSDATAANAKGLKYAQDMVACLRQKNGILENLLLGSVYRTIDAMPNAPQEFVGTWDALQPRCSYRHKLEANGEFTSVPMGCSLSAETFHGVWGVHDGRMIWLADEGVVWPPDINAMDVVDRDFFLLVERDGTRTRFTRAPADAAVVAVPAQGSPDWAVARGYDWARDNGIRHHADCRQQWTNENHESLERLGCGKYVTEVNVVNVVKPIPVHKGWDDGTTTAECVADVHAYWDPVVADLSEQGEDHAAASRMSRDVLPALKECNNFDNFRMGRGARSDEESASFECEIDGRIVRQEAPCPAEAAAQGMQGNAANEELHERLDLLQAQGVGMVQRPAAKPDADDSSQENRPGPMSGEEFRLWQMQRWEEYERKTEEKNRKSAAKLTNFLDEAKRDCGGKLHDYPEIGMSDETFRNCTIHARVGGVTQIVVDTYESLPLRLYVFSTSRARRVYSVDGVITAIKP
jgi:hypothetical protein